jgi:hypothetical protein
LTVALVLAWSSLGCFITTGPSTAIPAAPEQAAMKAEIPQAYQNDVLREEVLRNLSKASARLTDVRVACIPGSIWEYDDRTAAIKKGFMGSKNVEPEIQSCFAHAKGLSARLEDSYARFQDFRRKVSRVPHDGYLQRLTIMQGLAAMYYGRALEDFLTTLEDSKCNVDPLERFRKGARNLMANLVDGQIPAIMKRLKQTLPTQDMALLELEVAILSGQDVSDLCTRMLAGLAGKEDPAETAALTWCGYAAFTRGDSGTAVKLWRQAGQSVHDPDAASYALSMVRVIEDDANARPVMLYLDKE